MEPARLKWERARAVFREILERDTDDVAAQGGLAMTSNNLGVIYLALDQRAQAVSVGEDAVRASEQLVRINRSIPNYRGALAGSHTKLARAYERYGAGDIGRRASPNGLFDFPRTRARDHPEVIAYQHELGKQLTNLASFIGTRGKPAESRDLCREAVATLEPIAGKNSGDPKLAVSLAQARYSLAYLQLSMNGPGEEILAESNRAIAELEAVLHRAPGHAEAQVSLRRAWSCKAPALVPGRLIPRSPADPRRARIGGVDFGSLEATTPGTFPGRSGGLASGHHRGSKAWRLSRPSIIVPSTCCGWPASKLDARRRSTTGPPPRRSVPDSGSNASRELSNSSSATP